MSVIPWRGSAARERAKALHPSSRRKAPLDRLCGEAAARRYLATASEGRLLSRSGLIDLMVPYALTDLGVVLIPLESLGEVGRLLPGREVSLEVAGRAVTSARWLVRVSGTAADRLVTPNQRSGLEELGLAPGNGPGRWDATHGGLPALVLCPVSIRGYLRAPDAETPDRRAGRP